MEVALRGPGVVQMSAKSFTDFTTLGELRDNLKEFFPQFAVPWNYEPNKMMMEQGKVNLAQALVKRLDQLLGYTEEDEVETEDVS